MRVAITGASGLIGTALQEALRQHGHVPVPLVRRPPGRLWGVSGADLSGIDAVVHLAGENIGAKRWSRRQQRRIMDSRVAGTRAIAQAAAAAGCKVLVSMSAAGYYGDRDDPAAEGERAGEDFLAKVCQAWEEAAQPARDAGVRVVHPRMSVVLSRRGGALKRMLLPFRLGLGGPLGSGRQWVPWIHLDDAASALVHLLQTDIHGPVNLVAGNARQRDFAKALGRSLHRPAFMPLPGFAVRMLFGQMGRVVLLQGQALEGKRLYDSGFQCRYGALVDALAAA